VQLPARQLSCNGSISCNELPVPLGPVGQGGPFSYRTCATTRSPLVPGRTRDKFWPLLCNVPPNVSNTGIVAPYAPENAGRLAASTRKLLALIREPTGKV